MFDFTRRWIAFPLHPETPAQGQTLEQLFAGRPVNVSEMVTHLKQVAAGLGLPFGERSMTFNSRFAQELGKWAEEQGRGEQFHQAVFRSYFADGNNIGDIGVLEAIARSVDLSDSEARDVIETRSYSNAVDADWQHSYRSGVTAVPTFRLDGQLLVGAQPAAVLEAFLVDNGVHRHTDRQGS